MQLSTAYTFSAGLGSGVSTNSACLCSLHRPYVRLQGGLSANKHTKGQSVTILGCNLLCRSKPLMPMSVILVPPPCPWSELVL